MSLKMLETEAAVFKYMSRIIQSFSSLYHELCFIDLLLFVNCTLFRKHEQ